MKTRALLLALPLLAVAGCRDNRASIQIQAVCAPTDDCTFGETCDAQYIGFTSIDAAQTARLWLFLQVANQVANTANPGVGRANTADAHLDQAVVSYEGIGLGEAIYTLPNFLVPAGGSAVISVDAIPEQLNAAAALGAYAPTTASRDMVANVRLRGYYDDGSRFETGEFPVGVRVCTGCLSATPCGAAPTCPPNAEGTLPITCIQ